MKGSKERDGMYSVKPPYVMGSILDNLFPAYTSMIGFSSAEILVKVVISSSCGRIAMFELLYFRFLNYSQSHPLL